MNHVAIAHGSLFGNTRQIAEANRERASASHRTGSRHQVVSSSTVCVLVP